MLNLLLIIVVKYSCHCYIILWC